jgi:hypothetical protein
MTSRNSYLLILRLRSRCQDWRQTNANIQKVVGLSAWRFIIWCLNFRFLPLQDISSQMWDTNVVPDSPGLQRQLKTNRRRRTPGKTNVFALTRGRSAYLFSAMRTYLNHRFPGRRIGAGGPQHWPPSSPHINPPHFYSHGVIKDALLCRIFWILQHW